LYFKLFCLRFFFEWIFCSLIGDKIKLVSRLYQYRDIAFLVLFFYQQFYDLTFMSLLLNHIFMRVIVNFRQISFGFCDKRVRFFIATALSVSVKNCLCFYCLELQILERVFMNTVNRQKSIIYFDLDQTLFETCKGGEDPDLSSSPLSLSSISALSLDEDGVLIDEHLYSKEGEQRLFCVLAIEQEKFSKFFRRCKKINSTSADGSPEISINILTNNRYEEHKTIAALQKQHPDFECHNFANLERQIPGKIFERNGQPWSPSKGTFMDYQYETFHKLRGVERENVFLVDDSEVNCLDAEKYGFTAIRMGTNIRERSIGDTYTVQKDVIFQKLNEILHTC